MTDAEGLAKLIGERIYLDFWPIEKVAALILQDRAEVDKRWIDTLDGKRDMHSDHVVKAVADFRVRVRAEVLREAAKTCQERKHFYDGLALQCQDPADHNHDSAEWYEEKAGVCHQLEQEIERKAAELEAK